MLAMSVGVFCACSKCNVRVVSLFCPAVSVGVFCACSEQLNVLCLQ